MPSSAQTSRQAPDLWAEPLSLSTRSVVMPRGANILLIPGTSKTAHLRENIAGAGLTLSEQDLAELDSIGG